MGLSNLQLVAQVDSVEYVPGHDYDFLSHDGVLIGRILPRVVAELQKYPQYFQVSDNAVQLNATLDSATKRTEAIELVVNKWREEGVFEELAGWRNELYTVYNPSHVPYLFIERAASSLFGIVTYGVHIVGFQRDSEGLPQKLWVPRRSFTKPTYPGMLDNTIAGGLGHPHGIFETVVKESYEEAGLDEEYIKSHTKAAGVVTYFHRVPESGLYQPEVEYIYDLVMDDGVTPQPVDGEVAEFYLMDIDEVKHELELGNFKYNCALVTIDFFIRHGLLTAETEPEFTEIINRCHRRLPFPLL